MILVFNSITDFLHRLPEKEKTSGEHNEISHRKNTDYRISEFCQTDDESKNKNTAYKSKKQSLYSDLVSDVFRQMTDKNRNYNHVVDRKDYLKSEKKQYNWQSLKKNVHRFPLF